MPFYFYNWNEEIIEHLAEHGVSAEEFEEVVSDPDRETMSRSSGDPIAFGWTSTGRYLCCIYRLDEDGMSIEPVTAYDVED